MADEQTDRQGRRVYDDEIKAIADIVEILAPLSDEQQQRVMRYINDRTFSAIIVPPRNPIDAPTNHV